MSRVSGSLTTEKTVHQQQLQVAFGVFGPLSEQALLQEQRASIKVFKLMRADPQLSLAIETIEAPIRALDWKIEGANVTEAETMTVIVKSIWNRFIRELLKAVWQGFTVWEKIYELDDTLQLQLKKLKDLDPEHVIINYTPVGDFDGITQKAQGLLSGDNDIALQPDKVFIFSHRPEYGNLAGRSRFLSVKRHWSWKNNVQTEVLIRYLALSVFRSLIGRAPVGRVVDSDEGQTDSLTFMGNLLASIKSGGAVVMPNDVDEEGNPLYTIEMLQDSSQRVAPILDALGYFDNQLMRGMGIPDRVANQEGSTGAFSLVSRMVDMFIAMLNNLKTDIEDQITKHLLQPWHMLNFGIKDPDLRFVFSDLEPDVTEFQREFLSKLVSTPTGQAAVETHVDLREMFDEQGLTLREEDTSLDGQDITLEDLLKRIQDPKKDSDNE